MRSGASLLAVLSFVLLPPVFAEDWPHLRGPNLDGSATAGGALAGDGLRLELVWKAPLGLGYSGVAIADARAVTLYSDDGSDWVAAFDAATGERLWRRRIDATRKGRDGSDGGPLSSPVIRDGTVYALGPNGQLLALDLARGETLWSKTLPADFAAETPHHGFATTPLVDGDLLVVQTGGAEGQAISGLDRKTGASRWSLGDGRVEYQSPSAMRLAGRSQIVAVSGKSVQGIDPGNGKILWTYELGDDDYVDSANPTHAGDDRVLFFSSGAATVLEVSKDDEGFSAKELYRSRELGNTFAMPVHHDGYLYGFRGQILACVDAATGKPVWKSRPPGGRGLIRVDDELVIFGAGGAVVVAEASPEAYREKARLQVLEGSGYTWPSFAGGKIFVRNLEQLASVAVLHDAAGASPAPDAGTTAAAATAFDGFVKRVEAATDKHALIDEFDKAHERFPVLEGNLAHFVYIGAVQDIVISGTMIETGIPQPMQHIDGTDFYYKTFELVPGGRWEYQYTVDFSERVPDPRNPRTAPASFGPELLSVVATRGYEEPSFLSDPAAELRGTIETLTFKSESLGGEREVKVYLPHAYASGERSYPLLVVQQGQDWLEKGRMANSLDNLIGHGVTPLVVAFVAPREEWWLEAGGSETDAYVAMLANELVPFLQARYRLIEDPASRAVMGTGYFGVSAAYAALSHPGVFGKAALQSVALGLGSDDALMAAIRGGQGEGVEFYLDWNRYELRSVDQDVDLHEDNATLARELRQAGYAVAGGEALDSYGWGSWPARTDDILVEFFPE